MKPHPTQLFARHNVNLSFDESLSHLVVKNGFMLLGLQGRRLLHIQMQTARKTPINLPLGENDRLAHLHLDPRGMHGIVSTTMGKNFYLNMKLMAIKALRMPKEYVITAIAWNNKWVSNTETGFILLGTSNGHLLEANVKSSGELKYVKLLTSLLGEKQELPISDLLMSPSAQDDKNWMVIICQPGKLFCPVGPLNEQAFNPQPLQPIVDTLSSKIYSEAAQTALQNVVCRKNLQKFHSMNDVDPAGPSSFCVFPENADDCEMPSKFCWMSSAGIKFGKFESGGEEGLEMIKEEWQLDHKLVEGSFRFPFGVTLSQHHALLLFVDRFVAISLLTHKVVFEDVFKPETKPIGLCRDPSSQCIWVFGEGTIVNYRPDNEARDVWRSLVEKQEFAEARKITRLMADRQPYQLVIKKEAERFFNKQEYCAAAEILAESVEPFENIVLKFLKVSSNESRNGLKRFLELKLNAVQHMNRVQRDILVIWLFEIQLSELAELRRQVLHGDRESLANPKGGRLAHQSSQLEKLRNELEIFLNRSSVLDCVRDNRAAVYRLITTHADFNTQLYLAEKLKDYDVMIKIYLLQGDYKNALRTATSHTNAAIFYKYAKDFFEHTPAEFVKSLIELGRSLKPGLIVSSMANGLNDSTKLNAALSYLNDAVEREYADQTTHDFLIKILAEHKADLLLAHLKKFGNNKQAVPYNVGRALRVCSNKNLQECCVFLYCLEGMYETAVNVALTISVQLAKECAVELNRACPALPDDFVVHDLDTTPPAVTFETRKHIWLQIAKFMIANKFEVAECMKLLKESNDTIRIQDILGFFPEFTKINHFKQPLCACLKEHSERIKELQNEMAAVSDSAAQMRQNIERARSNAMVVKAGERCSRCAQLLISRPFFVFNCRHYFHRDCLIETLRQSMAGKERGLLDSLCGMERGVLSEVIVNSGSEKAEAEVKLGVIKKKLNDFIAGECPFCGHDRLVDLLAKPLISEEEYAKLEEQWNV